MNQPILRQPKVCKRIQRVITAVLLAAMLSSSAVLFFGGRAAYASADDVRGTVMSGPLSRISTDKGFDLRRINKLLDFLDKHMDGIDGFVSALRYIDIAGFFAPDGETTIDKANILLDFYIKYRPLIRAVLAEGEDRCYILVAQNTAELRASGGFPGAVGAITIKDGYLQVGDFNSVYDSMMRLNEHVWPSNDVTGLVSAVFQNTWDMCYCPDFPEVARIWADAYRRRNGVEVSGVLSLTPHLIQDLLGIFGDVTLSDGTVLSGSYAVEFISHDIYMKYIFKGANEAEGNKKTDELFYETAKQTLQMVTSSLSVGKLARIAAVVEKRIADGCIQVYMTDPELQTAVEQLGISGRICLEPEEPQLGMFYSIQTPSKMGWYVTSECSVGEAVKNEDGSVSYEVSLSYTNNIPQEDIDNASKYVLGTYGDGRFYVYHLFTAPAGGKITGMQFDKWNDSFHEGSYKGVQFMRLSGFARVGQTVSYTFTVTTAPGVDAPLVLHRTPTYTEYSR